MERIREALPRRKARITGVVYLLYFLTAILAQFLVGRKLIAYGNAANLVANGCYVVLTLLFYLMFKPVNRNLSLLAAFFSLAGCVVMTLSLFHPSISISPLLFFGPYCLLIGYLIFRSMFLPRVLGVLMAFTSWAGWHFCCPPFTLSLPFHRGPRHPRGSIADDMAHRYGSERSRVERTGQRRMTTSVYLRSGTATRKS